MVLIQFIHVIAEFFDSFSGFLFFFAVMFGIVGFLVRYAAWTVGIGAVFLTAVRRSGQAAMAVPPPASGRLSAERRVSAARAAARRRRIGRAGPSAIPIPTGRNLVDSA